MTAGTYVQISRSQQAFIPGLLPLEIDLDIDVINALSAADRAVGALSSLGSALPHAHLLIQPFLAKEAVASSRIEGMEADFGQLAFFNETEFSSADDDVRETSNYLKALNYGLSAIQYRPVSLGLLKEMHAILLEGVRGEHTKRGEFRSIQNYIGNRSDRIDQARYVPPPPLALTELLENLQAYIQNPPNMPPLVCLGIAHYQFEAIHPFVDGNGRLGRLLISLLLSTWGILPQPLLYLSAYFEQHRGEYLNGLLRVSADGAWKSWIIFMLGALKEQSNDALLTSRHLTTLREVYRERYQKGRSAWILLAIDLLFERPVITVSRLARSLNITYPTAMSIVTTLERDGVLTETTGNRRNRVYGATEIFNVLLSDMPEPERSERRDSGARTSWAG